MLTAECAPNPEDLCAECEDVLRDSTYHGDARCMNADCPVGNWNVSDTDDWDDYKTARENAYKVR